MGQTFYSLRYHIVFATRDRRPWLTRDRERRVYSYMGGVARNLGGVLLAAGGTDDHSHILPAIPPSLCVAEFVGKLKSNTSKWLRQTFPETADFGWQAGYGAFGVSRETEERARAYIATQREHHRKVSFREELWQIMRAYGIEPDQRLLESWGLLRDEAA